MALLDLAHGRSLSAARPRSATLLEPTADAAARGRGLRQCRADRHPLPHFRRRARHQSRRAAARASRLQGRDQGGRLSDPRPRASSCCAQASTPPRSPIPSRPRPGRARLRASSHNYQQGYRNPLPLRRDATQRGGEAARPAARTHQERSPTASGRCAGGRGPHRRSRPASVSRIRRSCMPSPNSAPTIDMFTLDTGRLFPEVLETVELSELRYGLRIRLVAPEAAEVEAARRPRRRVRLPPVGREPQGAAARSARSARSTAS